MGDTISTERIDVLEKRVSELKDQVVSASSPKLFMKAIVTLLLVGTFFFIWKARNIIKWLFLAFVAWMVFGGTVRNICSATGNFIATTWAEMRANGKVDDEHERQLERLRVETDAENSKVRTAADARTQVINAEEAAKQSEWERGQAERRNDAVNDAIRSGNWNDNTPVETKAPASPAIKRPHCHEHKPHIDVRTDGARPKIERTVNGNTTRVVVKF